MMMPISRIVIKNLRSYEHAEFEPHPNLNFVIGDNATGKSSILEAIHILSNGRSFRARNLQQACRHGQQVFYIGVDCVGYATPEKASLAIKFSHNQRSCFINGEQTPRISDLASAFRTLLISPDSHYQLQNNSRDRRAVLDWLLFHVKPSFRDSWARFHRSLEQRNCALRINPTRNSLTAWNQQFIDASQEITRYREIALDELQVSMNDVCRDLFQPDTKIEIRYFRGWREGADLRECLEKDVERDKASSTTGSGPHRADLQIFIDGYPAKNHSSHGQYKLIHTALRLAQVMALDRLASKDCCLLVDDLPAELDRKYRERVLKVIANLNSQVFVTATHIDELSTNLAPNAYTFHVEHGKIRKNTISNNKLHDMI